jgi:yecA family protein
MTEPKNIDFNELQRCLDNLSLPMGPAETQAVLYGLLCGESLSPRDIWLKELLPDDLDMNNLQHKECAKQLMILHDSTLASFRDSGFDFDLTLPEGERPLADRAAALVDWCRGFLYGLGLSGSSLDQLDQEAREGLADMGEITKLDLEALDSSEQQERELAEILEFIRVVVMLVREELSPPRLPKASQ